MLNLSEVDAHRKGYWFAPPVDTCPRCGTCAPRHETRTRPYWEADLRQATIIEVTFGCYLCPSCPSGERWFKSLPSPFRTQRQYTLSTQGLILDLIREYKMPLVKSARVARERFHLPYLDETTILNWFREQGEAIDHRAHVEGMVAVFSGQMALDEVYDGDLCQIVATDPLNNLQLDYVLLEAAATKQDVVDFLDRLRAAGFEPELVVTDGSQLYPDAIRQVWPKAEHQRCVFHFLKQAMKDLGKAFWKAYKTMPEVPKRKAGRPKKKGRPRKDKVKKENREKVRRARYLVCKREEKLTDEERKVLAEALLLCPALREVRQFALDLLDLFGPDTKTEAQATEKRKNLLEHQGYRGLEKLSPVLKRLKDDDLFARLTRYLGYENAQKTSNHVERENRELRNQQKTRYRFRSLASIVALLEHLLERKSAPVEPAILHRKKDTKAPGTVEGGRKQAA